MMETFIVLGLCFILYEALDFFQGCMHSSQPATSDRIESYRRQITEEKIRALQPTSPTSSLSASPIIGSVGIGGSSGGAGSGSGSGSVGGSTISIADNNLDISLKSPKSARYARFPESAIDQRYDINNFHQRQILQQHQLLLLQQQTQQNHKHSVLSSSASLPHQQGSNIIGVSTTAASVSVSAASGTVSSAAAFLPSSTNSTTNFSSLPRDYYYLQQQKHKNTTKFLTKFSSSLSDNRIFPELGSVVAGSVGGGLGISPSPAATFDIVPPTAAAAPLVLDLKRAIFSGKKSSSLNEPRSARLNFNESNEEYLSSSEDDDDDAADDNDDVDDDDVDEGDYSCSSDNDEHVKRIYSISEKF